MIELEISLVNAFPGWSLHDIEETTVESLLPFVGRFGGSRTVEAHVKKAYCDDVSWL